MKRISIDTALLLALLTLTQAGCRDAELDTQYGSRQSLYGGDSSVNGTGVLSEMFTRAGHTVNSTETLTPRLRNDADVFVWFSNDYMQPGLPVRTWMETWLKAKAGRTLIYVNRDYDAAPAYWAKAMRAAPPSMKTEMAQEAAASRGKFLSERALLPARSADWGWFTIDGTRKFRQVRTLTGDPTWTQGVNPKQLEIELNGRIKPSGRAKTLLASQGDILAFRKRIGGSQLIVIANGSFLLNLSLINHENRKLAGALVNEAGPPEKYVVFLESGGSPRIVDKDPEFKQPRFADFLDESPLNYLLYHLLILFMLVCFWGWPSFGFLRDEGARRPPDFGEHISALGKLLQATGDEAYARSRLNHYQQMGRPERGNLSGGGAPGRASLDRAT